MARANQGLRQDLNFQEIENEVVALSNLSEVGLAQDLYRHTKTYRVYIICYCLETN